MVVDTSVLTTVLNNKPVSARIEAALLAAPRLAISAATLIWFQTEPQRDQPGLDAAMRFCSGTGPGLFPCPRVT